jgi:selenocysteine lyase/cysteine desulfurase
MVALRSCVVGVDQPVPVLDGRMVPHVNLDNAASTPAFVSVVEAIERFLPYYSGVHRGTGYMSRLSTHAYESARQVVGAFVGADPERDVVIFAKNTTEAINKLARTLPMDDDEVVLTTLLEHHSNDLPWRARGRTVHVRVRSDGSLDEDHLDDCLRRHAGRIALLAVSGASNVTGVVQPIHRLARKVHAVGGRILVDAAQLAAHRSLDLRSHDDPGHLDFVALSAHKMYAPFGSGALVARRDAFAAAPDHRGGGTVHAVTLDDVAWAGLPDREEAGSPNVIGALALAAAAHTLSTIGRDEIADHETDLLAYALARLATVPQLRLYGPAAPDRTDRLGVIPFNVEGLHHGLVAAALGYEHAIGVRSGCFCAHPYITHLLGLGADELEAWARRAGHGDKRGAPGMVRISLGCYSDASDIDRAVAALAQIAAGDIAGAYRCDPHGEHRPIGYREPALFSLGAAIANAGSPGRRVRPPPADQSGQVVDGNGAVSGERSLTAHRSPR